MSAIDKFDCKCYLHHFRATTKKVFELLLAGDNRKSTKNTAMEIKYKKYSAFVKNVDVSKKL